MNCTLFCSFFTYSVSFPSEVRNVKPLGRCALSCWYWGCWQCSAAGSSQVRCKWLLLGLLHLQVSTGRHALWPHLQAFSSLIWMQKGIYGCRCSVWGTGLIMMALAPSVSHLFFFLNVGWPCFHLECVYIVRNGKITMRTGQNHLDRQAPVSDGGAALPAVTHLRSVFVCSQGMQK